MSCYRKKGCAQHVAAPTRGSTCYKEYHTFSLHIKGSSVDD